MNKKGRDGELLALFLGGLLIFGFVLLCMHFYPKYNVYASEMNGKADLREAEWNRQIEVQEAQAEKEAASLKAEAEIIRAKGISEANKIIAGSLTSNYIKYKFIEGLNDGNTEVIYVPTEANLPILEARTPLG